MKKPVLLGYCSKCGRDVEIDFCDHCGKYVQTPPPKKQIEMNNLVADILQDLDLTQGEFAFLFSCGQNQVSQWACGKRVPQKSRRRAIILRYEEIKKHPELIELAQQELAKQRKAIRAGLISLGVNVSQSK